MASRPFTAPDCSTRTASFVKSAARAQASLLFHACSNFLASARSAWRSSGSGVFVCWAKLGKAKLIASPTRATTERIFILSSWLFWDGFAPKYLLRDFLTSRVTSLSRGAGGTPLAERSLSGAPIGASTYSASMRNVCCAEPCRRCFSRPRPPRNNARCGGKRSRRCTRILLDSFLSPCKDQHYANAPPDLYSPRPV